MRATALPFIVAFAISTAGALHAQTAEAPAEGAAQTTDNDLSLGEPVESGEPGIGQPYIREEHGDWDVNCVRTEDGNDPCQLYQVLSDEAGNTVAEISVFPIPDNPRAEAGATIITPLETLLTQQVTLTVDGGQAKRYPFTFCAQIGCVARIGLLPEEVDALRRGAAANIRIVPAAAPDQEVNLAVSLSGFTAGYAAVAAAN
jgi:invasion protein IalB